ncbi:MAG: cytochrome c biogenesis CcdA family protein [Gammaproteobacteria bacterium]
MELSVVALGLAFLAGLVTTLSPCVLPILPMIASAATGRHPLGLVALAAGLAFAFTVVGVSVAASGHLLGVEERQLRVAAGLLMALVGMVLVSSRLQAGFTRLASGFGNLGHGAMARIRADHPGAQFAVGTLMGVAWSPCVGPTLGAAIALAAGGSGVAEATVIMATFSVAAVVPLTAAGLASRAAFAGQRERMDRVGNIGRTVMGWSLLGIGALILLGLDKRLEAFLLDLAPEWLLTLTTRF